MNTKIQDNQPISYAEVAEQKRLNEARERGIPWKKWGMVRKNSGVRKFIHVTTIQFRSCQFGA
jgi:hypothetical protein